MVWMRPCHFFQRRGGVLIIPYVVKNYFCTFLNMGFS